MPIDPQPRNDRCAKEKPMERCQTIQCAVYYLYLRQELPCPYYMPANRGYAGHFWEREGQVVRRQYFNAWIALFLTIIGLLFLRFALSNIKNIGKIWGQIVRNPAGWILLLSICVVFPIVLSLLNRRFFGRKVCLLNHEGLFCNQQRILWSDIDGMIYHPGGRMCYAYMVITGKKLRLVLPHAPYQLLHAAKKYNANIHTAVNKSDLIGMAVTILIIFIVTWIM